MEQLFMSYNLEVLGGKDKVRFLYALRGRDGKSGIVSFYNLDIVGKNVVLASSNYKNELISFFNTWKIPIKIYTINIKNIESLSFNE